MKKYFEYLLARFGMFIARSLPTEAAYNFGGFLGRMMCRLLKSRRMIAAENLRLAFPGRYSDQEIDVIVKEVFANTGRTLIEFTRFDKIGYDGIKNIVEPSGVEYLEKVHKEGKGGIIITAHFGNWELLGGFFTQYGYEVDAMVAIQHNTKVDEMVSKFRRHFNIGLVRIGGTSLRKVFKALKANKFIVNVPDQHDPSASLILDFFGRKTTVARGPALFAIKAGCPILPFLMKREAYNKYVVIAGEPIYPPNSGNEEADVESMSVEYMKFFEEHISKYPGQWLWTHRRWKI